ncbi:MFS transporter [Schaalia sp. lx-100]|uniref:MFS transporter n=1 Tax=Schaalia sp. lx-100 TaxID=2899081 RepID=UPI001E4018D5|nr:MFS transporter [Schaalia sp. lx-100]MCD4557392.1 MFS transporter [Schaalia sp. lx-100]
MPEKSHTRSSGLAILIRASGPSFLLSAAIGRLPAAMIQLGILLVVTTAVHNLGLAGMTVAMIGIGTACGAPIIGRLADQKGPLRVISAALIIQLLALMLLWCAIGWHMSDVLLLCAAALVGMANPQIGSIARALWSDLAHTRAETVEHPRLIRTAMGYETAIDELSFVFGPAVSGLLVTLCGPLHTVAVLAVMTLIGEGFFIFWLAIHRSMWAPNGYSTKHANKTTGNPQYDSQSTSITSADLPVTNGLKAPMPWLQLTPYFASIICVGMVFGSTQTALTAIHTARDTQVLTGPIYGAMGLTSACAGFLIPALGIRSRTKFIAGGLIIALGEASIAFLPADSIILLLILCIGMGVGTVLVSAYASVERLSTRGWVTSAMTIGATCVVLGVSAGSAATGYIAKTLYRAPAIACAAGLFIVALHITLALTSRQGKTQEKDFPHT